VATVVATGIDKRFAAPGGGAVEALANVDLSISDGEFVCLLGPSGCGKTTLLNVMAGLMPSDAGNVEILPTAQRHETPDRRTDRRPVVRTVFQEARLLPWMTVRENLAFVLDGRTRDKHARIDDWLDRVGLAGTQDFYPRQLSIGMQQRVSVARGLIVNPDVLFMDEPFGALDELTAMTMREELLSLWGHIGCTIVFVTHNPLEAALLADRIVIMGSNPGRIVHEQRLNESLARPRDPDDIELWRVSRGAVRYLRGDADA